MEEAPHDPITTGGAQEWVGLLFIGSPLLDITVYCGTELLRKYGLKPDNCVTVDEDRHDTLFRDLFRDPEARLGAGGSAFNSANIAKWTLKEKGKVAFAGCVGEDEYASRLFDELRSSRVEPLLMSESGSSTGVCACLLSTGGHRSMVTRRGAAALFSKIHLDAIEKNVAEADCIFVVGYFLSHSPEVVFELARRSRPTQLLAMSLSAEYICRDFKDALLRVMPRVDVLLGNEAEFRSFAGAICMDPGLKIEDIARAAARWKKTGGRPRIVIVTRGLEPVIFARGEEAFCFFPVPRDVPAVDSVGCGDALAGAFLAAFTLTGNADDAVRAGIVAAVEILQRPGCSPPPADFALLLNEKWQHYSRITT